MFLNRLIFTIALVKFKYVPNLIQNFRYIFASQYCRNIIYCFFCNYDYILFSLISLGISSNITLSAKNTMEISSILPINGIKSGSTSIGLAK